MDQSLEKKYSVEVPKLGYGLNKVSFHIDRSFFEAFEFSPIQEADMEVQLEITRSATHLDAKLRFTGWIGLECDRCLEPYHHELDFLERVVYSFDEELEFDTDEVILIEESVPVIHLAIDFYDFILLEVPLRKVPPASEHLCAPEVLELLNLNPDGTEREPLPAAEAEEFIDPRWLALKNLQDTQEKEQ